MKLLEIYILGLIISTCIFYIACRINTKNNNAKLDKKKLILGTIFYPIIWIMIIK
jgi:hypothetical protein